MARENPQVGLHADPGRAAQARGRPSPPPPSPPCFAGAASVRRLDGSDRPRRSSCGSRRSRSSRATRAPMKTTGSRIWLTIRWGRLAMRRHSVPVMTTVCSNLMTRQVARLLAWFDTRSGHPTLRKSNRTRPWPRADRHCSEPGPVTDQNHHWISVPTLGRRTNGRVSFTGTQRDHPLAAGQRSAAPRPPKKRRPTRFR